MSRRACAFGVLACLVGSVAAVSPAAARTTAPADRGAVVSATRIDRWSAAETRSLLRRQGFAGSTVKTGLTSFRLRYRTVGVDGRPVTASALIALPRNGLRTLPVASYTHGTMVAKADAPTVDVNQTRVATYTFAAAGYAAVAPDYLGLGSGRGTHPYMHVRSEVTATVDALRAARDFAAERGRRLAREVRVSGFSQGGAAAMSVAKALQAGVDRYFRLRALAPISGPYELRRVELPAAFDGRLDPHEASIYLGYLVTAYNRLYHLYDDPAEAFRAPYDRRIDALFNGWHSDVEVWRGVPADPRRLLTPHFVRLLQHPTGRLARLIDRNDRGCRGWSPAAPVTLVVAGGDLDVTPANAYACQARLASRGVSAPVVQLGEHDHFASERLGVPYVVHWLDRIGAGAEQ